MLHLEHCFVGVGTWTPWKVDTKYLESFEVWCWRKKENINWVDRVRNEEVLNGLKKERNILQTMKRRKAKWIGHMLHKNCLLKHVIEGKIKGRMEVTGRRRSRSKQLVDDLKERRLCWIALCGEQALEEAVDLS